jgi:hypothetical protein
MLSVIYALSVANKPYMQSVVMLSVVESFNMKAELGEGMGPINFWLNAVRPIDFLAK